jgi:hypothetical protein
MKQMRATMTKIGARAIHSDPQRLPAWARWARLIYTLCAWLFAASIVLQVFFAGLGVLVNPGYFDLHRAFGPTIELFPVLMLVAGVIGRLPWRVLALTALGLVLFMFQYIFLYAMPRLGLPTLRALHAVNALALFWLGMYFGQRAWRLLRESQRAAAE